jgi:hypothetical protein
MASGSPSSRRQTSAISFVSLSASVVVGAAVAARSRNNEIFEATVFIAYRLAFATVNDALGAVPDQELIARVPPRVREAVTFGRMNTVGS